MDHPEEYLKDNVVQQKEAEDVTSKLIEKMIWKSDEIVLDLGCGPGDVSSNILYRLVKNNVKQLVGVDKSNEMIKYAQKTYGCTYMDFKVLDIENADDCTLYTHVFDKIFSFFCFHWIRNEFDALLNIKLMLKSSGEICIHYLSIDPVMVLYKSLNTEWQTYVKEIPQAKKKMCSKDKIKTIYEKAGFRTVSIETNEKRYTFPNLKSLTNTFKRVDMMFQILPPQELERYSIHVRDVLPKTQIVEICPTTGKTTLIYNTVTVHAVND